MLQVSFRRSLLFLFPQKQPLLSPWGPSSFFLSFFSPACMAKSYLSFPLTARGVAVAVAKRFLKPQPYLMKEVRAPAEDPRKSAIYWPFAVSDNIPPKKPKERVRPMLLLHFVSLFHSAINYQFARVIYGFVSDALQKKSGLKSELILSLV